MPILSKLFLGNLAITNDVVRLLGKKLPTTLVELDLSDIKDLRSE